MSAKTTTVEILEGYRRRPPRADRLIGAATPLAGARPATANVGPPDVGRRRELWPVG
ncbi:MAG: hypothetical protein ACYDAD_04165 [Acidimicrobiales bacterium]